MVLPITPYLADAQSSAFGALLRRLRVAAALSQNGLARAAGIDPAYVNRLERGQAASGGMPRRAVVLRLYEALVDGSRITGIHIGPEDRDDLLAAAGLVPEAIVQAGGWASYSKLQRATVIDAASQLVERVTAVMRGEGGP